jgi:hypothetical protein
METILEIITSGIGIVLFIGIVIALLTLELPKKWRP